MRRLLAPVAVLGLAVLAVGCASSGPRILGGFGDRYTPDSDFKLVPRNALSPVHRGIDIAGYDSEPVLAAAAGEVQFAGDSSQLDGIIVLLRHGPVNLDQYFTQYNHLSEVKVKVGQTVERGQVVGLIGRTGLWRPHVHVHFELQQALPGNVIDPAPFVVGCFSPKQTYQSDRLVLTWPVKC
jgi:murein DD-endopeptidase MepM/ murein hydrolase activator NlpD